MQDKLSSKDKEVNELVLLLNNLKLERDSQSDELEFLQIENKSLKGELEDALSQKSSQKSENASLNESKISKSIKYPEVICPHFKNGGQCVHCIRAWKAAQKEKKK